MRKRDELVLGAVSSSRVSRTGWMRGNCAFCEIRTGKPDRKQCLGLQVTSRKWHCFRCGTGGIVQDMPDDFSDFKPNAVAEEEQQAMEPPEGFTELYREPGWSSVFCEPPREYLRARGLDDDLGFDAHIGACFDGRIKGRVVVPIFDVDGTEWLGWSARAWFKNPERKYLYPSGMRRAEILFNHAALQQETDAPVYVVEGVFDALALWPDGVAVLGKPSSFQVEALVTARRPVVIALDGDAWREAEVLALRLRFEGQVAGFVRLQRMTTSGPSGSLDPDELDRVELERRGLDSLTVSY